MSEIIKTSVPVIGMACAACAVSVQTMLQSQPGVASASVNYGNRTVKIEYDPSVALLPELRKVVQGIGYDLFLEEENAAEKLELLEHKRYRVLVNKLRVAVIFGLPVFVLSMLFHHGLPFRDWILLLLSVPVVLYSGSEFYVSAYRQIRSRSLAMDSLIATGTGIAFIYSLILTVFPGVLHGSGLVPHVYFESAAVIIGFILLGRYLEEKARRKASSSIRALMGLTPGMVTIERDGELFDISPALVVPGDVVKLKPGDRIPVDGLVQEGSSLVDQSSINGEPLPRHIKPGDEVLAGTMNLQGFLVVKATCQGNETLLARVIRMVDEAQSSKPPVQQLVEKISGIFVPLVFLAAFVTFAAWLIAGGGFTMALITSVSVLIIACPCALGLATPAALIAGIGRGASEGVLVRNASVLEIANKVDLVVFDKTGTLTEGKIRITETIRHAEEDPADTDVLVNMESRSNHPMAAAILASLAPGNNSMAHGELLFEEIPGKGVSARNADHLWLAGSRSFMEESGVEIPVSRDNLQGSRLYFAKDRVLLTEFLATDEIRTGSLQAVEILRQSGIESVMVSGDQEAAARQIATACGIGRVYAGVLPDGKGNIIKLLQEEGHKVAMVGDGINDAYALAQADLGIAMGTGTDIAMETASMVLVSSDLRTVARAIRLSRSTLKIIRQNLFWAFFYNIITIPLAAGVLYPLAGLLLNPMLAGAAMAFSSVSVMLNSIRLNWIRLGR